MNKHKIQQSIVGFVLNLQSVKAALLILEIIFANCASII